MNKKILDACCSARQFWWDKENPSVEFVDIRAGEVELSDRKITISPTTIADFRDLPFPDEEFFLVVFDPPHVQCGENSNMARRFGHLDENWRDLISRGFDECWRVLKKNGTLVFKWNETTHTSSAVIDCIGKTPLFGHKCAKRAKTHWMIFFKDE